MATALFGAHIAFPEMLTSSFVVKLSLAISILTVIAELTIVGVGA